MSFIFEDKNLINSLLKLAADPVTTTVTPQIISGYEAASKLLYKLQSDLGDETAPKATAPIGSESTLSGADSELKVANLRTLGDFINWLADKKITWDGKRIAWTPAEHAANPNDPDISKAWVFSSLSFDRNEREIDRKPTKTDAFANKDGLISYLSYLRDSQEAKENNVFKFMVGALIGEANGFLRIQGQTPIATKPTAPGPGSLLDPKLIIDVLPDVLDSENPLEGLDGHPFLGNKQENNWLQYSDIATPSAFSGWLRNRKVRVKKGTSTMDVGALDTNGDPCIAIHILYKRASQLSNVAQGDDKLVPNYTKAVAEYLKNIQAYGSNYKGPDGYGCAISKPGTLAPSTAKPAVPGGTQPGGKGKTDSRTLEILAEITAKFPLDASGVSFDQISAFCTAIEQLNYGPWNSTAKQIEDYIRQAKSTLSSSKPTTLRDGISLTTQWSRSPKGDYVIPFASSFDDTGKFCHYMKFVETIVDNTASLISSFLSKYKGDLSDSDYAIATSQVGSGVSASGSIYYYNKRAISDYLSMGSCFI